jgi:hypothetical protein
MAEKQQSEKQSPLSAKSIPNVTVFCAHCQEETPHEISVQPSNKDIVLTCSCGRFVKFAKGTSKDDMKKYLAAHKEANVGQVLTEKHEQELQDLVESVARDLA